MLSLLLILKFIDVVIMNLNSTYNETGKVDNHSQALMTEDTQQDSAKIACMIFAATAVPIVTILLYSIIWYEHFGLDAKRTIINKLLSSALFTCIEFVIFVQLPDIARYVFGPLPKFVCLFQFIMKNATSLQILLFFDGIIVARYFYIFYLKNPAGFQDEFWNRFISIWVFAFSSISQAAFVYLPGRQPLNYYICVGKITDLEMMAPLKINSIMGLSGVLTFFAHVVIGIKIHKFKRKVAPILKNTSFKERRYDFLRSIENQSLTDLTTTACNIIASFTTFILLGKQYIIKPTDVNVYPNYIYIYLLHLVTPLLSIITLCVLYYARNAAMRKTMLREAKAFLQL
jgi:hypothetical protein